MGKFLFRWFVEIPAALHAWVQLAAWLTAGGTFVLMAVKGIEVHVLLTLALVCVASALIIGNQLPVFLQRLSDRKQFTLVAGVFEELAALGRSTMTTQEVAHAWGEIAGDAPKSIQVYLKFRRIKAWINDGTLKPEALNGTAANMNTTLRTPDLATFFREQKCKLT